MSASALNFPKAPVDSIKVLGPCECGRAFGGDVVTVTPPDVILVDGIPHLLCPVIITLLLSGGTGVTYVGVIVDDCVLDDDDDVVAVAATAATAAAAAAASCICFCCCATFPLEWLFEFEQF